MKPIDQKITKFSGAPIRRKRSNQNSKPKPPLIPQDEVKLRKQDPELEPDKPKKSLGRHVLEKGFAAVMLTTTLAGIAGGIGVATNSEVLKEAMNQEKTIYVFGQDQKAKETPSSQGQENAPRVIDVTPEDESGLAGLQDHLEVSTTKQGVSASLGAKKTQALVNHFRQSDAVQSNLDGQLAKAESKVNEALQELKVAPGETLLTARVPFPSGEGSIMQVGDLDLNVGLKSLAMEELPLVLSYEIDPVETGLSAKLSQADVDQASLPKGAEHGVHLGSVRAEVNHGKDAKIPLSGKVKVDFDDGSATKRALAKTSDPVKRAALQARLKQIERIQKLSKDQNLDSLLDFISENREVEFSGTLEGKSNRVADGLVHAWLTPDHDQDQRGDVRLSGELYTAALDSLEFKADKVHHTRSKKVKEGGVYGFIQNKIADSIEEGARDAVPRVMTALRGTIENKIQEKFRSELGKVEQQVDATFDATLDAAEESGKGVGLGIESLDIDAKTGDLVASLDSDGPLRDTLGPKISIGGDKATANSQTKSSSPSQSGNTVVPIAASTTVQVDHSAPSVVIPGSSARRFLNELVRQPEVKQAFQDMTEGARKQVEKAAGRIAGPSGSVDVNVQIPFPSQEGVDSPIGQIPKLARKDIPFQADYQVDDFGLALSLDVKPVEVDEAVKPKGMKGDGVFIGAIRVSTQPMTSAVSGDVQLHKGKTKGGAQWAEKALDEAFEDQNFGFKSQVSVGETESLFYIWVVPDNTGDGKADVAVAHRSVKSGAESLKVQVDSVSSKKKQNSKSDGLGKKLNGVVSRVIQDQLQKSGDKLGSTVSNILESKVGEFLGDGSNEMSRQINEQLGNLYSKIGNLDIPVPEGMKVPGGKLNLQLGDVRVSGDSIVSEYGNERTAALLGGRKLSSGQTDSQTVAPGELRAHVPGVLLNRLLSDTSEGGPLDWNNMLEKAAKSSSAVKSLSLAKDDNGKTISPSIRVIDGKPTLAIQIDGETNGIATPISAGARVLPGFIGDGLGWISDKTVGALLGSRLQTEVQVPLDFGVQNGQLKVGTGEVKFATPADMGDFNILDILPTRMLSSLIVDGVASTFGPSSVNELLAKQNLKADLSDYGLEWTRVEVKGKEGKTPNLTVGVTLGQKLPEMVGEQAAKIQKEASDKGSMAENFLDFKAKS